MKFQSLSRDSGRLNCNDERSSACWQEQFQSLSRDSGRLNVTASGPYTVCVQFQSLSRDSGRLNG